jgi:hypothetical protein
VPKRAFGHRQLFTNNRIVNYRKLQKLEQEANSFPQDAARQAILYKVT